MLSLRLPDSLEVVVKNLASYQWPATLANWSVTSYQTSPPEFHVGIARLSVQVGLERGHDRVLLIAGLLLRQTGAKCKLEIDLSDPLALQPADAAKAWLLWFCDMLAADYEGVADQLESLAPAAVIGGGEGAAQGEPPKPGRFGSERDLSFDDVSAICRRVRDHQVRGGRVPDWHRDHAPENGPGSYGLETLRGWLKDTRFGERPRKVT